LIALLLILGIAASSSVWAQPSFTVRELAEYRLSLPTFRQFEQASRRIADVARDDRRLADNPLFTREVLVLGDAVEAADRLEARLTGEPALAAALLGSQISAHDYTRFALALFGARLAHGFVKSGAIRFVPDGVAKDNVAFVEAHEREIADVLRVLGIEGDSKR
jgi:hypothetical protein